VISRAEGDATKYIVAQTVPEDDVPRLHLLATGGDPRNFRIVWEGDMPPGTEVGLFDRRSVGSSVSPPRLIAVDEQVVGAQGS
jgi:hypothetical protein